MVIVRNHPRHLPRAILVLPQVDKARLAQRVIALARMMKPVHTNFERAISFHRINLQRPRHQLSRDLAANIVLDRLHQRRPAKRVPGLVVIELHVLVNQRSELFQVAFVIRVEQVRIEHPDRLFELRLRVDLVQRQYGDGRRSLPRAESKGLSLARVPPQLTSRKLASVKLIHAPS
jgi:hypothetical protein